MIGFECHPHSRWGQAVILVIAMAAGIYFAGRGVSLVLRQHGLFRRQAVVQGRILVNRMEKPECAQCPDWRRVDYGYEYGGRSYTGRSLWPLKDVGYSLGTPLTGNIAEIMENRYKREAQEGSPVTLYLDARHPDHSYVFSCYAFGPCVIVMLGMFFVVFLLPELIKLLCPQWLERRPFVYVIALLAWVMVNGAAVGEYSLCGTTFLRHASVIFFYAVYAFGFFAGAVALIRFYLRARREAAGDPSPPAL